MNPSALLLEIEAAWANVAYPGDMNIFTPDSYDDEDVTRYFSGTTWKGHTPAELRAHCSSLGFFTPAAYQYWLAAFLVAAVEAPDELSQGVESILYSVDPSMNRLTEEHLRILTRAQKLAMLHALEHALGDCFDHERVVLEHLRSAANDA